MTFLICFGSAFTSLSPLFHKAAGRTELTWKLQMVASGSKTGGRLLESAEEYSSLVMDSTERPVLVFWTAPWCGPCRLSIPIVKEIMKQYAGKIDSSEVCTDDLPEVAADAGVVSIPTIQIYFRGAYGC